VIPDLKLPLNGFAGIISNSLLHHLDSPLDLWQTIQQFAPSGCQLFVMDLRRPQTLLEAERLVATYSGDEPEQLKSDFLNSLLAAYETTEVEAQLQQVGLALEVEAVGDRHLLVHGRL